MGQLEDMTLFIRVVEAEGISRAAAQLGIAKSAVSRRLMDLETRLGVRLLNRTTRTSSLTEAGQEYYERALRIVDDVTELNAMTVDESTALEGTINLAAPLSFGLSHLTPAIDSFIREHPGIRMNIDFSDRHVDLVEEGLDLAFRIARLKDSSLVARRICPIRIVLSASPAYLEEHGRPESPADLKHHRLLHYTMTGARSWKLLDQAGNMSTVKISGDIQANNGEFLKDMAVAGHGIVASPTFICWKAIATGDLVPVLCDYRLPEPAAYAVYPGNRYLSRRVRALVDYLVKRFGENPYWDQNITP
ncbi:MAG: LysR family transcriptional regulator [Gammaproteobacteria bacterium]|nr:LysR family transcriptional regulator [Gammaproteobacteria bacterium]